MQAKALVIDDKYEVLAEIGEGGMSRVYLARDKRLNKQWAIKEIKTTGDRARDELIARSFVKEANMMKQLDHPYLPRIVDIVSQNDIIYVIMDYIEGQSLAKILGEHGPQPQESVVGWGLDLCEALDYLHTRTPPIIYRDMKPANVMLRPDGTVRIVDFGTAREYKESYVSQRLDDTTILGTRGYAAPEQFGGIGQTDPRTDVYCLGATLYHLLTGMSPAEPPYELFPIRQINPSFSPGLEKVISTCVQQNPAARYQNCAELYYALENYDKADDAHFKRQRGKLRTFIVVAALTVALLLGGGVGLVGNRIIVMGDYDTLLKGADYAPIEDREGYLVGAIELLPENTNAYLKLIAHYESDGELSNKEYTTISLLLDNNRSQLTAQDDYPSLAFEVGKLFWYYYTEKDTYARSVLARDWFGDARSSSDAQLARSAEVHFSMTSLVVDLSKASPEGVTEGAYREHYLNLTQLAALLEDETNRVIKLRGCTIVLVTLQKDLRFFMIDGVSEEEARELYDHMERILDSIVFDESAEAALYKQLRSIEAQKPNILEAIDDAYQL